MNLSDAGKQALVRLLPWWTEGEMPKRNNRWLTPSSIGT